MRFQPLAIGIYRESFGFRTHFGYPVEIPFSGRKWEEMDGTAEGGLTNKILGYIAIEALYKGVAT
jgi:hypothetical protein